MRFWLLRRTCSISCTANQARENKEEPLMDNYMDSTSPEYVRRMAASLNAKWEASGPLRYGGRARPRLRVWYAR